MKTLMLNTKHPFSQTSITNSCSFYQFYRHEEIGDSDYGAVYTKEASCSEHYDIDEETEEEIQNFDRNVERECCELDFWQVLEVDKELLKKLADELSNNEGKFSETYELFKMRYT